MALIVVPQTYENYCIAKWIWVPNLFIGGFPHSPTGFTSNVA